MARAPLLDCAIVGGGPAGLSAAIYMGRFERSTLVLDDGRGRWSYGQATENYLGFPNGVSARRLRDLARAQAARFGVRFADACVATLARGADGVFTAGTEGGAFRARTLIWAAGVVDLWPSFPGARALVGRSLFWCLLCDGHRTKSKRLLLVGANDKAARTALQFLTYTRRITFLAEESARVSPRAIDKMRGEGIVVLRDRIVRAETDGETLRNVTLAKGGRRPCDLVFSLMGSRPRSELVRALGVPLARNGHVRVDEHGRTEVSGVFAAGDVTNRHAHQVANAVAEGAAAATAANQLLYGPDQRL